MRKLLFIIPLIAAGIAATSISCNSTHYPQQDLWFLITIALYRYTVN